MAYFLTFVISAALVPADLRLGTGEATQVEVLPYRHPSGAVIWVRLHGRVEREIVEQLSVRRRT